MNATEVYNSHLYGTILVSIWTSTFTITFFIYYLIYVTRSKLTKIEICIVSMLNTFTMLYKVARILKFLFQFILDQVFGTCSDLIFLSLSSLMHSTHSIIFFYYAIYHVTNLSRHPIVSKAYRLVRKMSLFIGLMLIAFLINIGVCLFSILYVYLNDHQCINARLKTIMMYICQVVIPCALSILVYFISLVIFLVSSLRRRSKLNMNRSRHFKREITLIFKFLVYKTLVEISNFPQLAYYIISITSCLNCGPYLNSYVYLYSIGDFFTFIQPFFLIYTHNIIKESFIEILRKFYLKVKNLFI